MPLHPGQSAAAPAQALLHAAASPTIQAQVVPLWICQVVKVLQLCRRAMAGWREPCGQHCGHPPPPDACN